MPDIIEILKNFFDSRLFLALQILGGIVSLALLWAIVVLINKGGAFERHIRHLLIAWKATPIAKHRMVKRWIAIREAMETQDSSNWRSAIAN